LHAAVSDDPERQKCADLCERPSEHAGEKNRDADDKPHGARAAKSAIRASDSRLMPDEFDKLPLNGGFDFACPMDPGRAVTTNMSTAATPTAIVASAPRNPSIEPR
jgi:hypothetical protein